MTASRKQAARSGGDHPFGDGKPLRGDIAAITWGGASWAHLGPRESARMSVVTSLVSSGWSGTEIVRQLDRATDLYADISDGVRS